jgi:DNA mismatch repair ATPase MutS
MTTNAGPAEKPLLPPLQAMETDRIQMLRCGAFYELRRQDAETAAAILGLKLGRRGPWPMTGVPIHKAAVAAAALRARGFQVELLRKMPGADGKRRWTAEKAAAIEDVSGSQA